MSSEDKVASERWAALEANPEVMTKLCHQVSTIIVEDSVVLID